MARTKTLDPFTPQEIEEETVREIPGVGCTWYPDEQPLSNEALTVLLREEARCWRLARTLWHCPQRLAVGQAQTHGLVVCVTQVRVDLFCDGNTVTIAGWYGCTWS